MIFHPTLYLPAIWALTGLLAQSVPVAGDELTHGAYFMEAESATSVVVVNEVATVTVTVTITKKFPPAVNTKFQAPTPAAVTELAMAAATTVATTKRVIEKPVSTLFDPSTFAALYSTTLLAPTSILSSAVPSEAENIIDAETGPSDTVSACPTYTGADAIDISSRELAQLASRAGEEFWFRYEDPSVTDPENGILQLAPRPGAKNFDDQAYKWISTNAAKIKRGSMRGRIPAIYVLPAGTRDEVLGASDRFEDTSEAKEAVGFVTKDNEPGDVGINGVQPENGVLPLDAFRDKIIRTVVKTVSGKAGGKEALVFCPFRDDFQGQSIQDGVQVRPGSFEQNNMLIDRAKGMELPPENVGGWDAPPGLQLGGRGLKGLGDLLHFFA